MADSPETMGMQACLRQALRIFLPRDEVSINGKHGTILRTHEDRTCTVLLDADDQLATSDAVIVDALAEKRQRVIAVEVWAGMLVDVVAFIFQDGSRSSYGEIGGEFVGRFALEDDEFLTKVIGTAGDCLDSIRFQTCRGRSSQSFGNPGGGRAFELKCKNGQQIVGVKRGLGAVCPALRGLVCQDLHPQLPLQKKVRISGLTSPEGQLLNGSLGVVTDFSETGRVAVTALDGAFPTKALRAENLTPVDANPEVRVLLANACLEVPHGNFTRRRTTKQDYVCLHWSGRCELNANGQARLQGRPPPQVGREGVHHVVIVCRSDPIPVGMQVVSVEMTVTGMDQQWGNTGDSGVVLYIARIGEADGPGLGDAPEPLAKALYDRRQSSNRRHIVKTDRLEGPLAPQPGDCLQATLHCPNYRGWSAHVEEISVRVFCERDTEFCLPGSLPDSWRSEAEKAFSKMCREIDDDSWLTIDPSHLSLRGQELQHVWQPVASFQSCGSQTADPGPTLPRLIELYPNQKPPDGAQELCRKLDQNTTTAGAPQDCEMRRSRYRCLRSRIHSTFDALENGARDFVHTVCLQYASAAKECIYRWEREIANMHDLVTGTASGDDAVSAEVCILRLLCDCRRQLAEAALHRAKGSAANSDMHFENYFYGSIHFGLPEQLEAAKDPNRLNYGSLNMVRPSDIQKGLTDAYTPAAIRDHLRRHLLESSAPGVQAKREKLLDSLRASIPVGFNPTDDQHRRLEAWIYEFCHDTDFRMTDVALNFLLCRMHVFCATRIACLVEDHTDVGTSSLIDDTIPSATAPRNTPACPSRLNSSARCVVQ